MTGFHPKPKEMPLVMHPSSQSRAVRELTAHVTRTVQGLEVAFVLKGDLQQIVLPEPEDASLRRDELWLSTCFEVFIRAPGGPAYLEFNFAPSGHWACYEFSAYREGMRKPELIDPEVDVAPVEDGDDVYVLQASLTDGQLGDFPDAVQVALSAVVEERDGAKSYWALKHAAGKPDFHHDDSFALELQ